MKTILILAFFLLGLLTTSFTYAQTETEKKALPQIRFFSMLEDEYNFDLLKASPQFANLTKEAPGAPIRLVSFVQTAATAGGNAASFTSIMLSASTLGVVPVVSNDDITITYRMYVNGNTVLEYIYKENFTDTDFFWSMDFSLSDEAKAWAASTVEKFLVDVEKDEKLKALIDEYNYYFIDQAE